MNKSIIVFCIVFYLCFGGICKFATAQTSGGPDNVLVPGAAPLKKSDVDKMIEFYEWAFEAAFTGDERERYLSFVVEGFRRDAAASRKDVDVLIKVLAKARASSPEQATKMRRVFNEGFVADLRRSDDEGSRMLLDVYERGQGGGIEKNVADQTDAQTTGGTGDSYETVKKMTVSDYSTIAGTWVSGNTGSLTTTTTGVYLGGNASRHTYRFSPNGAVEYTGIMNTMAGGCRMQIFKTAKGKAFLSGDRLTINWSPASFSREDSCSPSKNYKKTLPAETETLQIFFETYFDDKQLCIKGADKTCFSLDL